MGKFSSLPIDILNALQLWEAKSSIKEYSLKANCKHVISWNYIILDVYLKASSHISHTAVYNSDRQVVNESDSRFTKTKESKPIKCMKQGGIGWITEISLPWAIRNFVSEVYFSCCNISNNNQQWVITITRFAMWYYVLHKTRLYITSFEPI